MKCKFLWHVSCHCYDCGSHALLSAVECFPLSLSLEPGKISLIACKIHHEASNSISSNVADNVSDNDIDMEAGKLILRNGGWHRVGYADQSWVVHLGQNGLGRTSWNLNWIWERIVLVFSCSVFAPSVSVCEGERERERELIIDF